MIPTGSSMVMVSVVITLHIRIVCKCSCQISFNRFICISRYASKQTDTCLSKCHLSTASNTTANQHICV